MKRRSVHFENSLLLALRNNTSILGVFDEKERCVYGLLIDVCKSLKYLTPEGLELWENHWYPSGVCSCHPKMHL